MAEINLINNFVFNFPINDLNTVFRRYDGGGYNHLLSNPRRQLSIQEKQEAIRKYLQSFILQGDPRETERPEMLRDLVNTNNYAKFIQILRNDQFYEEP